MNTNQCGIIFNRHCWSKWEELEEGIISRNDWNLKDREVGRWFSLKRKCEKCGDVQFERKRYYYDPFY